MKGTLLTVLIVFIVFAIILGIFVFTHSVVLVSIGTVIKVSIVTFLIGAACGIFIGYAMKK